MGNTSGRTDPPQDEMVNMDMVLKGLYIGGFLGENEKKILKRRKITHVVAIHDLARPKWPKDFKYKCIRAMDNSKSDLSVHFSECVDFIHQCRQGGGVAYVHCAAGMSRSVTILVAYLMTISTLNFDESLRTVQHCRRFANPNSGFREQLQHYQDNELTAERRRVLEELPNTHTLGDEEALQEILKRASGEDQTS